MKSNIQIITEFLTAQMDGETVPAAGSAALAELGRAIADIQKHQSSQELQVLALHCIGAVINRASSSIAAQNTLQQFIRGDDHA